MTVAYSDTFPAAGGCHCNRLALYSGQDFEQDFGQDSRQDSRQDFGQDFFLLTGNRAVTGNKQLELRLTVYSTRVKFSDSSSA